MSNLVLSNPGINDAVANNHRIKAPGVIVERLKVRFLSCCARVRPDLAAQLLAAEVEVQPAAGHQLVVRPLLHEPAPLEHEDQVGVADRAQAVRDDEDGPAVEQPRRGSP